GLEADPGPEGEEQPDADRPGAQLAVGREALEGVDGVNGTGAEVALGEQVDVEDDQDHHFADQPDREDHGGEPDVEVREDAYQHHHAQGQPGPGDVHPEGGQ